MLKLKPKEYNLVNGSELCSCQTIIDVDYTDYSQAKHIINFDLNNLKNVYTEKDCFDMCCLVECGRYIDTYKYFKFDICKIERCTKKLYNFYYSKRK